METVMTTTCDPAARIGITATVPIEVLLAAGRVPQDLNNVFIAGPSPAADIQTAESHGFPVNCCAWIKGIYGAARRLGIREVVGVAQGDCSNTHALMEIWAAEGVRIHHFEYPFPPSGTRLAGEIDQFCAAFGATRSKAEAVRLRLDRIRDLLRRIDDLSWRTGQVRGGENHLWLVGASDFGGDPDAYESSAAAFLCEAESRPERQADVRLGAIGIPPICHGLFDFLEGQGSAVVFNEFQRQFAMIQPAADLVDQYLRYTYPYGVAGRIEDIRREVQRRRLDGLIHYVQSFCFRHIQDRMIREGVGVPVLTLEVDRPGPIDGRSRTRLEAFLELIRGKRRPEKPQA